MDEISFKILKILQKKARIPNVEVARQVALAPSAVLERIRKLEKQGIIEGYEVRLNPKYFTKSLVAFVTVKIKPGNKGDRVGETLAAIESVQEVHLVAGDDAYLVKLRAADPHELGQIVRHRIAGIKGVQSTRTVIALETVKETARIPIDENKEGKTT
ncbi:MAG: Lrp/AsnC family transcriptional regulator [Deltaproteobacteria bacterium]|nr:MAG: Lrp/AsnC family transcriptional regulator [Deltaproteobacteria bacterium]